MSESIAELSIQASEILKEKKCIGVFARASGVDDEGFVDQVFMISENHEIIRVQEYHSPVFQLARQVFHKAFPYFGSGLHHVSEEIILKGVGTPDVTCTSVWGLDAGIQLLIQNRASLSETPHNTDGLKL
jgi:hypothetical protein